MPRSIQEILDHADELAKRFEDYEPDPGDERPVEEYLIQRAALARARSERQIVEAVTAARSQGHLLAAHRRAARHVGPGRPTALRRRRRNRLTRRDYRVVPQWP